jgi:hypothetical protein
MTLVHKLAKFLLWAVVVLAFIPLMVTAELFAMFYENNKPPTA